MADHQGPGPARQPIPARQIAARPHVFLRPPPINAANPDWYNDLDLAENREFLFGGVDLFGKTYLCNVADYYELPPQVRCGVLAVIAIAEAHNAPRSADPMTVMVTRMISESIVPRRSAATLEQTREKLCEWARALWRNQDRQVEGMRLRMQDYAADRAAGGRLAEAELPDIGAEFTDQHHCWTFIVWMADRGITDEMRRFPVVAYVYTYVAMAKRGTITIEKMRKIAQAVTLECGIDVTLDRHLIGQVWGAMSARLGDQDYRDIFAQWEQDMMGISLRMRITLIQAACSGLTSLVTCRNAIVLFRDFDWPTVAALLPSDTARLIAAAATVGNDRYYGFRKDYGAAASSGYKSFTWVAKELLIRYGGPDYTGLRDYRGWTTNPLHRAQLQELIDNYTPEAGRALNAAEMQPLYDAMTAIRELL